jgi:hypothetical protein
LPNAQMPFPDIFNLGLGGTSLLNANIFLQADKKTLELSEWPADIRENPEILDPCECESNIYLRRLVLFVS